MTIKKDILRRAIDLDLTDDEIQEIEANAEFAEEINIVNKSDYLSKELLLPGYSKLIQNKSEELFDLLDDNSNNTLNIKKDVKNKNSERLIISIIGIATIVILVLMLSNIFKSPSNSKKDVSQQLKMIAINSFDNSGLLHGRRSVDSDREKLLYYDSYQNGRLISDDNCIVDKELCYLTNAVTLLKAEKFAEAISILNGIDGYIEIKNKLLIYSYYQMDDKRYLENVQIININKFPKYTLINSLLE